MAQAWGCARGVPIRLVPPVPTRLVPSVVDVSAHIVANSTSESQATRATVRSPNRFMPVSPRHTSFVCSRSIVCRSPVGSNRRHDLTSSVHLGFTDPANGADPRGVSMAKPSGSGTTDTAGQSAANLVLAMAGTHFTVVGLLIADLASTWAFKGLSRTQIVLLTVAVLWLIQGARISVRIGSGSKVPSKFENALVSLTSVAVVFAVLEVGLRLVAADPSAVEDERLWGANC